MKISKLFHWLYASIMLMPIFAIGVKSLYITFNPNAKESYYGETINEEIKNNGFNGYDKYYNLTPSQIDNVTYTLLSVNNVSVNNITLTHDEDLIYQLVFYYDSPSNTKNLRIDYQNTTSQYIAFSLISNNAYINFYLTNKNNNDLNNYLYYFTYNRDSYLDNAFYYAVDEISQNPLFSWANSSFLNQPILYITGFFGLPNSSPIITLLSFWLNVSIIWLVYDLIMYVPLLVHRWLDKGVIE